jgi:predicted transcriptional regulator
MDESNEIIGLKKLGEDIRIKRQQLGYRQVDLAEICEISDKTLREVEAGSGKVKIEIWIKLGQILGLELVHSQKPMNYAADPIGVL